MAALARGFALFLGAFTLAGVVGAARGEAFGGFDANIWWVALPFVGGAGSVALMTIVGVAFVAYAGAPRMGVWRRRTTVVLCLALAVVTVWNGVGFYLAWRAGEIRPGLPLPLSFVLCVALVFMAAAARWAPAPLYRRRTAATVAIVTASACALLSPPLRWPSSAGPTTGATHLSSSYSARRCTRTVAPRPRSPIAWTPLSTCTSQVS